MVRCLQDMEQHYRGALEEKVWEIIEMRDANEALSKQFVDANAARATEKALAQGREEQWVAQEHRCAAAEDKALRLEKRVRALLKYEELYAASRVEIQTLSAQLAEARKSTLATEDSKAEVSLALEQGRNGWEMQRADLRAALERSASENRVLTSELEAVRLSLENREAELARWSSSLGSGLAGADESVEGGLAQAEKERETVRREVRGLHNAVEHKDAEMASLVGQMDMLLQVINNSATIMVRQGGGHERLLDFLVAKCRKEEQKRQREATAAAKSASLDRRIALEALQKRGDDAPSPGTAEAVGELLANTMGVAFPACFYERLGKEPAPVPLGGAADAKASQSRETEPTAAKLSTDAIEGALFHDEESYPHSLLVSAYMPAEANEQQALEAAQATETAEHAEHASLSEEESPTTALAARGPAIGRAKSHRRQRRGGGVSRSTPDLSSQSLRSSLPSGDMSEVLSSLQSMHAVANFPSAEPPAVGVAAEDLSHLATSEQASDIMGLLRDIRAEMREVDEVRQRDSDALKMQMALVLEGNGEIAENGRRGLHLGREVSEMVRDMREMQVESDPWIEKTDEIASVGKVEGQYLDPRHSVLDSIDLLEAEEALAASGAPRAATGAPPPVN